MEKGAVETHKQEEGCKKTTPRHGFNENGRKRNRMPRKNWAMPIGNEMLKAV